MPKTTSNEFSQEFLSSHIKLLRTFSIIGGFLFIGWALTVSYFESAQFEIWPIRILISLLLVLLGLLSKPLKFTLLVMEWSFAVIGFSAIVYAFTVSWNHGLHPTWITGSVLIIVGVLSFLTYLGPTIFIGAGTLALCLATLAYQDTNHLMNPASVFLNFITAVALGSYSSIQRNRFLIEVLRSQAQQNQILTNMSEAVILHDKTGRIIAANPSAPKILGLSSDQMLGKDNMDPQWKTFNEDGTICTPDRHPSTIAIKTGMSVSNFTMLLQRPDQSKSWLDISAVPIFNNQKSETDGALVTIRDITNLKKALETVESQRQSLFATSKLSALGEMSAGIAHEINNPLAVIMGNTQQLERKLKLGDFVPQDLIKNTDTILRTTERISKIISSMRSLSRQNDSDDLQKTNLSSIFSEVSEVCQEGVKHSGIDLKFIAKSDVELSCHRGQIGQVILNLINNAKDAIQNLDEKWIQVEGKEFGPNEIEISITDSGSGIPKEIQEKIMQPFFTTKEIGKGTGLGLSLVRSIVLHHQGKFVLDSNSKNTRFVIHLPKNT